MYRRFKFFKHSSSSQSKYFLKKFIKTSKKKTLDLFSFRHEYHKVCIDPWLLEHRTCPMCKLDILKHYGFVVSANQTIIVSNYDPMIMISADNNSTTTTNPQLPPVTSSQNSASSNSSSNNVVPATTPTSTTAAVLDGSGDVGGGSFTSISVSIEHVGDNSSPPTSNSSSSQSQLPPPPPLSVSTGTMTESRQITDV